MRLGREILRVLFVCVFSLLTDSDAVSFNEFVISEHVYSQDAPVMSVEGVRTIDFNYYARLDHLTQIDCTPTTFDEYYTAREDRLVFNIGFFKRAVIRVLKCR